MPIFRMFLRIASIFFIINALVAAAQGNASAGVLFAAAAILTDLQADVLFLKEEVLKLKSGDKKDATQSTQGS